MHMIAVFFGIKTCVWIIACMISHTVNTNTLTSSPPPIHRFGFLSNMHITHEQKCTSSVCVCVLRFLRRCTYFNTCQPFVFTQLQALHSTTSTFAQWNYLSINSVVSSRPINHRNITTRRVWCDRCSVNSKNLIHGMITWDYNFF